MPLNKNGKIIKRLKIGKKKVVIIFDDEDKLEISPNTYVEFNLYPKKVLTDKDIKDIKKRDSLDKAFQDALKIASKGNISEKVLREKLLKKEIKEKNIDEIIKMLQKYRLLDENAIIEDYLTYASYKNYGKHRIIDELYKKGVKKEYIDSIKFKYSDEFKKALTLLKKVEKKYDSYSFEAKKVHIYELLMRYGFESDVISEAMNEIEEYDSKNELSNLKRDYQKALIKYKNKYKGHELTDSVIKYLLSKGYRYVDIKKIKGD